jgi:two-component system sensor histidine kinase YesM
MRLQNKILILFSLLFTGGFLFLMFFSANAVERTNSNMVDSFSTQSFEFKSQEVGQWLGQRLTELRVIAMNSALEEGMIQEAVSYIGRLNENLGTQYGNEWGTFAVGYKDGIGWVSPERYIDISEREYFHEAMKGEREYVLSAPVISRTDQAEISLICYPLRNRDGKVYGFLNAAISLKKLHDIVAELDFYNGQSWIMDPKGNIYTRSGADEKAVETLLPHLSKEEKGFLDMENGAATVFYTRIPYTEQWYLCTSIENSRLMEDTRQLKWKLSMVLLIVMILLFLCSVLVARSVTNPIGRLTEAMKRVETGDWQVSLQMKGQDEIARLSRSFDQMVRRVHSLVLRTAENEREKRNAELRVLQAQINPHFLYNTLDTLQYKAYDTEDEEMVTMISALSTFFRISLSRGREIIPLEKELEHVKSYLKIQKIRFQDVLAYEFQVEVREPFPVLKLILQPLVENAIQHGIKPKMAPGAIYIRVTQQEGTRQEGAGGGKNERRLVIEVEDDGVGIETKRLEELKKELREGTTGKSYGLINVNNRIRLLYGEGAGVTVRSQAGKGTCVRVVLTELSQENEEELYG